MEMEEKRRYERLSKGDLPVVFRTLLADLGEKKNLLAETVDVSTRGIGVSLSVPRKALDRNEKIKLHSPDNLHEFIGRIVHAEEIERAHYRVGVALKSYR